MRKTFSLAFAKRRAELRFVIYDLMCCLQKKKKKNPLSKLDLLPCPAISYLYYQSDSLDLRRRRHRRYYHVVACISRLPKRNYKEPGVVKVERIAENIFEFATHNNARRPPTGWVGL